MKNIFLILMMGALAQCFHGKAENQVETGMHKNEVTLSAASTDEKDRNKADLKVTEEETDSLLFERIISDTQKAYPHGIGSSKQEVILHIARAMTGTPYVAKTLEVGRHETLVINLRQLDCTTYVENVVAIYLCIKNQDCRYSTYKDNIRRLRYAHGKVAYSERLHYFTQWIAENTRKGIVKETQAPNPPFTSMQCLSIDFMSTHPELYPRLKNDTAAISAIRRSEEALNGKTFPYIPKAQIANSRVFRQTVHNGDIIAITTRKAGLDTSHIGIAVWHKDGLHLLNASQIHKKVVEEPMLLRDYMQKHPSQTGVRIVNIL